MEQWHQKLHNNTSPDDVIICQVFELSPNNIMVHVSVSILKSFSRHFSLCRL